MGQQLKVSNGPKSASNASNLCWTCWWILVNSKFVFNHRIMTYIMTIYDHTVQTFYLFSDAVQQNHLVFGLFSGRRLHPGDASLGFERRLDGGRGPISGLRPQGAPPQTPGVQGAIPGGVKMAAEGGRWWEADNACWVWNGICLSIFQAYTAYTVGNFLGCYMPQIEVFAGLCSGPGRPRWGEDCEHQGERLSGVAVLHHLGCFGNVCLDILEQRWWKMLKVSILELKFIMQVQVELTFT